MHAMCEWGRETETVKANCKCSAFSYILDNASDPGVSARQIWIDVADEASHLCLTFTDNGSGMTPNKLHKMLR